MEPEQSFIAPTNLRDTNGTRTRCGEVCVIGSICDSALIPIPDAKLSKADVHELYLAGPVRTKETA